MEIWRSLLIKKIYLQLHTPNALQHSPNSMVTSRKKKTHLFIFVALCQVQILTLACRLKALAWGRCTCSNMFTCTTRTELTGSACFMWGRLFIAKTSCFSKAAREPRWEQIIVLTANSSPFKRSGQFQVLFTSATPLRRPAPATRRRLRAAIYKWGFCSFWAWRQSLRIIPARQRRALCERVKTHILYRACDTHNHVQAPRAFPTQSCAADCAAPSCRLKKNTTDIKRIGTYSSY